jgi:hypothetical protein
MSHTYKITINNGKLKEAIDNSSKSIERILDFFNLDNIETSVIVMNYEDFKYEFKSYLKYDSEDYSVGFIEDSKNRIIILDYDDYKYTPHDGEPYWKYTQTVIHEFVHLIHSIACNKNYPETKLWEGIAVYLAKQYDFENKIGYGAYYEYGLFIYEYLKDHSREELLTLLNVTGGE